MNYNVNAANRTASANGNWSSTTTWGGSSVPTSGDAVTINGNVTVTVDNSSAVCASLSINPSTSNQTGKVDFSSSSCVLTISGSVTLGGTSGGKRGDLDMNNGGTLKLTGSFTVNNTVFTPGTGTIEYNASSGTQTVSSAIGTYNNLTLSGGSTKNTTSSVTVSGILTLSGGTVGAITVNGTLVMAGGSFSASTAPTYGSSATLKYSTTMNTSSEWPGTFAATGGVIINSGTVTLTGAKVFNSNVPLTINSGAALTTSGSNYSVTVGGSFTNSGTCTANGSTLTFNGSVTNSSGATFNANTSSITFNADFTNSGTFNGSSSSITIGGTATTQSIAGFTTTGTVSMTKTGGTATFGGDVSGGAFTMSGNGGTLNLGTSHTHTFTGTWTMTAGDLYGSSSTLKLTGGTSGSSITFHAESSTVEYNGSSQTVVAFTNGYNNLTLSGSGTITTSTSVTVSGVLTLSGGTAGAITVNGTLVMAGGAVSTAPTYGASATLKYSTTMTASSEWLGTFAATGGVIINSGTVTLNEAKTLNASVPLTINSGGALTTSGNNYSVTVGGNFTNSGTCTANGSAITFKGNFTNSGTFNGNSSSITIDGTATSQSIAGFTTTGTVSMTKTAGTATLDGDVNGGAFTMSGSGGTLNLGTSHTHTFTGTWTMTAGDLYGSSSTLKIGGAISGSGITFHGESGTVQYTGSTQTIAALDYNNLSLSTASSTMFPTGTVGIAGTFTIGTFSTATQGTINFNGSTQTVPSITYNNLTLSGSGTKTLSSITVSGILSMDANVTVSGTPTYGTSATLKYNITRTTGNEWLTTFAASGGVIINSGTVTLNEGKTMNASVPLTINSGGALNTSSSNYSVTAGGNFTNSGTCTANSSSITFKGDFTNTGTFNGNNCAIIIDGASTQNIAGFTTTGAVTVTKSGNTATLAGDVNAGTLTINCTSTGTLNLGTSRTHTISGALTLTAGTTGALNCSSSTLRLGADVTGSSTIFEKGTGTVNYNSSSVYTIAALTYNNLSLTGANSGTLFPNATVQIYSTFTPANVSSSTQGTINFKGASPSIPAFNYYNLDLTGATGTASYASGTIGISGTFTPLSSSSTSQGTINFKGSSQTIPAFGYNNLDLTNATSISFASGTVGITGTFTPGTTSTASTGTIDFNGSIAQTIPAFEYNNLTVSGSNSTKTLAGAITVDGSLTINSSTTTLDVSSSNYGITIKGNWINNQGTFTQQAGTVTFNSTTQTQTIGGTSSSQTFNNITINKSGRTLSVVSSTTSLTASGNLTLTAGTFDAGTATTISIGGDWTNNASTSAFTGGSSTVVFYRGAQTIGGTSKTTFAGLNIQGTDDKTLSADIQVDNTLTLTNKNIITSTNVLTANTIVRSTTGHIVGNLKKNFSSGNTSRTFELGAGASSGGRYTPITLSLTTVIVSGYVTASVKNADHSAIESSNINPGKKLKLYWTITKDVALIFTGSNITFQYNDPDDRNAGAVPSSFIVGKYISPFWFYPTVSGTPSATSTTITGVTTFGDFQIGESVIPASSSGEEFVYWTDLEGTTVSSDVLTKTASNGWNAGAASENFLLGRLDASTPARDGFVKFTIPSNSLSDVKAFGLSDNNASVGYVTIDHCFYLNGTSLLIYENGQLKKELGSLQVGDELIVERVNEDIYYIKNNIVVYHQLTSDAYDDHTLIVDASIYNQGGTFAGMTCSFKFFEFIADAAIDNQTSSNLGSVSLTFPSGYAPYEIIWNGTRYPGEALLDTIIDTLETRFSPLVVDNSLYDLFEDLKYNPNITNLGSCRDTVFVIDSLDDVHKLLCLVGREIEWLTVSGLNASTGDIPKWKQGEVTLYYGSGISLTKSAGDGWGSGYASSENIFGKDKSFYLEFSVPQILSQIAVGIKPAIITSDNSSINNLSDLRVGFLFDNNDGYRVMERGLLLSSGTYNAGDVFAISRAFDPITFKETFTYFINGSEIAATDGESNNYFGYNSYRLGVNVFKNGAAVTNIIINTPQFDELNALIKESSYCEPTGAISLDLNSLPIENASQYTLSFLWSTGATTNYILHLEPGVYTATVTATPATGSPLTFTSAFTVPANTRWTALVHTAYSLQTNSLTKQSSQQRAWDGSATSRNILLKPTPGWVQFKTSEVNDCIFGLNENDHPLPVIDFGAIAATYYPHVAPQFPIRLLLATYPNGSSSTPAATLLDVYTNGDKIKINRSSTAITLSKNYDAPLFTFSNFSDENLVAKACIFTNGNQIIESTSSFPCKDVVNYSSLEQKLDGSYYAVSNNKLRFGYTEEYIDGNLNYKVFDSDRNEIPVGSCSGFNPSKHIGYNIYELDLSGCSLSQGYYTLEVYGEKKERFMLRFKL